MSLKAKLEAVIYAAEEPVTLAQLAQIFAADALEWKAAQETAAAEATAELAGQQPTDAEPMTLIGEGLENLPMADTAAMSAQAEQEAPGVGLAVGVSTADEAGASAPTLAEAAEETPTVFDAESAEAMVAEDAVPAEPVDAEAEARRIARLRDREIKSILKQILDELTASGETDDRGVHIREIAGGYRMATKPECHDAVRLFVKSLKPPLKLSLPALETLAVVAYKQPVTAPEVSEIRGVEAGGVLGSLLARKLVATAGRKPVIGRPILYKTTKEFLLRFGLKDLNELPSMEEFEKMAVAEIEEMEPEAVAADAAQTAAEADEVATEAAESEDGSSGDTEAAESARAAEAPAPPELISAEPQAPPETPTDETSDTPNEQDATGDDASHPTPAEPDSTEPAEIEADPNAEKVQEEHRA
jgi:segregation and condensation protein B